MTGIVAVASLGAHALGRERLVAIGRAMAASMPYRGAAGAPLVSERALLAPLGAEAVDTAAGSGVLTGRLDRPADVARALGLPGDTGDAELIVAGWNVWGERVVDRATGEYAAVLWDARERRLVLLRDALGIKPLYLARRGDVVVVASEVHALFASGLLPAAELEPFEAARFAAREYAEERATVFRHVIVAQPGGVTICDALGDRRRRVWSPDPFATAPSTDPVACGEALREALAEAVRIRMPDAGRTVALVSGGLDSSTIACLAANLARRVGAPAPALLHLAFPGLACDEATYFDAVVARTGARSVVVDPRESPAVSAPGARNGPGELYEPTTQGMESLFDAASLPRGTVVLNGYGGDDLLRWTGLECLDALHRRKLRVAIQAARGPRPAGRSALTHLALQAMRAYAPALSTTVRRWRPPPSPWSTWITPTWRERLDAWNAERIAWRARFAAPTEVQRRLALSLIGDSDLYLFLARLDRMGARRGLDLRFPFYDRRVIEVLMATPAEQRGSARDAKDVLREGMRGVLPEVVRRRGVASDLGPWIREMVAGPHREAFRALLRTPELERLGIAGRGSLLPLLDAEDPAAFVEAMDVVGLEEGFRTLRGAQATYPSRAE